MNWSVQLISNALKTTVSNIRSNNQVFWVSVGTMTIAFSIIGLFLVIFVNLHTFLTTWSNQVQLIVYLRDDISPSQFQSLKKIIAAIPEVEKVDYISREAAWNNFKNTFSEKSGFVSDLEFNPLPASFNIGFKPSADRLDQIRGSADRLAGVRGVESLEYGAKWISGFEKFMIFSRVFLMVVSGLLGLGLILIISNTIRLSFYSRRDEIELMLLIGATPGFVKTPFLLEGICQGFLGSAVAVSFIKLIQLYMEYRLLGSVDSIARGLSIHFISPPLVGILLLAGMTIGLLGSYRSINKILQSDINK